MSEMEMAVPLPLDGDGFLRRECPTCEREFKWLPAEDEAEATPPPDGGYFCPYCGIQAPPEAWHTKAQIASVEAVIQSEIVEPALQRFDRDLRQIGRRSGGLIKVASQRARPAEPEPLTESDDMKRIDFDCHPTESIKVLDDWRRDVACLVCGRMRLAGDN